MRQPLYFERTEVLRSPATGVWHPKVGRGQSVQKGALIGVLTDFFGAKQAEIRAPFGGIVLYVVGTPAMSQGADGDDRGAAAGALARPSPRSASSARRAPP